MELQRRASVQFLTITALVAMLGVGVLVTVQLTATPEPPKKPTGGAKVAALQRLLRQIPDQMRLELARDRASSGLAADLVAAVKQVDTLVARSAVYPLARAEIHRWNRQIIELAQVQAKSETPAAIEAGIDLLLQIPETSGEYAEAQAQIEQWRPLLIAAPPPATVVPPQPIAVVPKPTVARVSEPTSLFSDIALEGEQTVDSITLRVFSARIQSDGSFQLNAQLTNNSSQRYVFLPGLVKLTDSSEVDRLGRVEMSLDRGIVPPDGVVRLTLNGRSKWQPPYRIRLEENRISGQRDFNLPVVP